MLFAMHKDRLSFAAIKMMMIAILLIATAAATTTTHLDKSHQPGTGIRMEDFLLETSSLSTMEIAWYHHDGPSPSLQKTSVPGMFMGLSIRDAITLMETLNAELSKDVDRLNHDGTHQDETSHQMGSYHGFLRYIRNVILLSILALIVYGMVLLLKKHTTIGSWMYKERRSRSFLHYDVGDTMNLIYNKTM